MIFNYHRKPIYFITKKFDKNIQKGSVLILSPEFYWVRNVSLNVKYIYEAKKMAQSIFDGLLPNGDFEYKVYKISPKNFIFLAYDLNSIKKELSGMGIDFSSVGKIYLAQNHIASATKPIKIDNESAMIMQNKVLIPIPLKYTKSDEVISLEQVLPKKFGSDHIYAKNFGYLKINKKMYKFLLLSFVMICLILLVNILNIVKQKNEIEKIKNSILKSYNLPRTSFERKSILGELTSINNTQTKIRKLLDYLGKFKFVKSEHYVKTVFEGSHFDITVNLKDEKRKRAFKQYISKKFTVGNMQKNGNNYYFRINL